MDSYGYVGEIQCEAKYYDFELSIPMELRSCSHLHFIQTIKGGSVTKVLNVARGRPRLAFKDVAHIYDCTLLDNSDRKAERSNTDVVKERIVKTVPGLNANDGNDQIISNLDDDGFDNFTLQKIKESCKTRKWKHSQGFDSTKKRKVEDLSSSVDYRRKQMAADDSDFMETLSSWRSKLSMNVKDKKRKCTKTSTCSQEIILVVNSEEIHQGQQFPPCSGDSASLVEVKFEGPEAGCFDGTDYYFDTASKGETEINCVWNLENELHYNWEEDVDLIPLQMISPSCVDLLVSNSELSSDQSPNFPAIEFEEHNSVINGNQLDGDNETPASPLNIVTHKGTECIDLECRDANTSLSSCNEFTACAEVQAEPSSNIEHGPSPEVGLVSCSDDSPEYEEKQSFASVHDDEKRHVNEATDELASCDDLKGSPKLHRPEKLLSTRKAISPSSQEKLCKAMEIIDMHHINNLKSRGKLYVTEQTIKNGAAEGINGIMGARFTDNPNKISAGSKTSEGVFHSEGTSRIPHSSRPATHLRCSSEQSCSNNAIIFSKRQLHDTKCIAERLTEKLKSMKDIVDVMLRSEFCLPKSLRYKVTEARIAVKKATIAEEDAKRYLSFMARDCSRFCKIMKLADAGPSQSPPQDGVRKGKKKVAFADEAGGRLCQVRVYEDGEGMNAKALKGKGKGKGGEMGEV